MLELILTIAILYGIVGIFMYLAILKEAIYQSDLLSRRDQFLVVTLGAIVSVLWLPVTIYVSLFNDIEIGDDLTKQQSEPETVSCKFCGEDLGEVWSLDAKAFCSHSCKVQYRYRSEMAKRMKSKE